MSGADIKYQGMQAITASFSRTAGYDPDVGHIVVFKPGLKWIDLKNKPVAARGGKIGARSPVTKAVIPGHKPQKGIIAKEGAVPVGVGVTSIESKGDFIWSQSGIEMKLENIYVSAEGVSEEFRNEATGDKGFRIILVDERILWQDAVVCGDFNITTKAGGVEIPGVGRFEKETIHPGKVLWNLLELVTIAAESLPTPDGKPIHIISFPEGFEETYPRDIFWKAGVRTIEALRSLLGDYRIMPVLEDTGKIGFYIPYTYSLHFEVTNHPIETERIGAQYFFKTPAYAVTSTKRVQRERIAGDFEPVIKWDNMVKKSTKYKDGEYVLLSTALSEWGISDADLRNAILQQGRSKESDPFEYIIPGSVDKDRLKKILTGQAYKWFQMKDKEFLPMLPHRLDPANTQEKLDILAVASVFGPKEEKDVNKGLWKNFVITESSPRKPSFDLENGVIKFQDIVGFIAAIPSLLANEEKRKQAKATKSAANIIGSEIRVKILESIQEFVAKKKSIIDTMDFGFIFTGRIKGGARSGSPNEEIRARIKRMMYGWLAKKALSEPLDELKNLAQYLDSTGIGAQQANCIEAIFNDSWPDLRSRLIQIGNEDPLVKDFLLAEAERAKSIANRAKAAQATFDADTSIANLESCELLDGIITITYAYEATQYFTFYIGTGLHRRHISVDWILYDGIRDTNIIKLQDEAVKLIAKDQSQPPGIMRYDFKLAGPIFIPSSGEYPHIAWDLEGDAIFTKASRNNLMVGYNGRQSPIESIGGSRGPRTKARVP